MQLMEDKTEQMAESARKFSSLATQLKNQQKNSWF
jgi:hypothetical protein